MVLFNTLGPRYRASDTDPGDPLRIEARFDPVRPPNPPPPQRTKPRPRFLPLPLARRLQQSPHLQKILANTGWLFANKILRLVLGVTVGAWVARYLGPAQYGELTYVLALVMLLEAVGKLGLDQLLVRDIAGNRPTAPGILGTAFRLRLATGIFLWLGTAAAIAIAQPGDTTSLLLAILLAASIPLESTDVIDIWFQSETQSRRTVLAKSIAHITANLVKIVLILMNASLVILAAAWPAESLMGALALAFAYARYRAPGPWQWSSTRARHLLRESWPWLVSGISVAVYMRIDQVMLRAIAGEQAVGLYSAAIMPSEAWYFIPSAVLVSAAPTITRKKSESESDYLDALKVLFSTMWAIAIPLAVTITLSAGWIIDLLYGAAYAQSAIVLSIHVFAVIPVFLGVASTAWLINERRSHLVLTQTLLGAAANVSLNLFLIPRYGPAGAAAATVASQFLAAIVLNLFLAPRLFALQFASLAHIPKLIFGASRI